VEVSRSVATLEFTIDD